MLRPAGLEHAALAPLIRVAELALGAVRDHLDVAVRVKRPDRARRERVVVEDAQRAEAREPGVVVLVEGEVLPAMERAVLDPAARLVDAVRFADADHACAPLPVPTAADRPLTPIIFAELEQVNTSAADVRTGAGLGIEWSAVHFPPSLAWTTAWTN